ncbi:activity-dependent neuroprotector homeobox protein 2 isoform X2 [Rana temporaria]|uniref:activity-dependent neuroprotector homeobox protein 2 isoform X2 n=1 Tax=Rana temporaria TaxID=8407 RepID=UPI001AACD0AC|nr:activity-dependent neuroprotector homeobox protein 2 isoform X2 [Rana temporaria]
MFQTPVNNLENIRKTRKRVKQLLLQIGLDTCREAYEGYRSKQFCCSLCSFSTRLLTSLKGHLQRYHEDEKDQEMMASCPRCPFTSHTKNVVRHMRIFHSSVRKVQTPATKDGQNPVWTPDYPKAVQMKFSCVKCSFTDSLYYTIKRHVLSSHHKSELEKYFGEKSEEELKGTLGSKVNLDNRFYCKKCNYTIHNHDALMYHILTSDKHRDLEQKLRPDISEAGRSSIKRPYRKVLAPPVALSPKPTALPISPASALPSAQDAKVASLPQNGPNQPLLGASTAIISNIVPSITSVPDPAGGIVKTSTTVASTAQVGFVTTALPQNQSINLQASLSQSMFLSPRFTLNQPVTATMLPSACGVGGPVNQSTMIACPQSLQSGLLQINQNGSPTIISVNQPLKSTIVGNQPQNAFLATSIIRQLIPTGKQVNGIPTYTLVTLPVAPCAIPAVNPLKAPLQLSQPVVSTSPASAPSPPIVKSPQTTSQNNPIPKPTPAKSPATASDDKDKTRQWKTCPVCNELFPSNVYEVHMQIAHIKQEKTPDKPTESATSNDTNHPVVAAAHASFLKVVKEKSIRCVTCRAFTPEEEVLQHLLMHGMVCLYCKAVFYELRNFIYHMKILHVDKKNIHGDFARKGITVSCDANGTALFPHFDLTFHVSKEELGEKEMHIAVVAGANSNTSTPLYIKIQTFDESTHDEQGSKCSFCEHVLSKSEALEMHYKDKHHIMPTMHTILKSPAFKCIHCCGVYTGSMTLSAIALHLQRCRNAPKDSIAALELSADSNAKGQSKGGSNDSTKGKPNSTAETQLASNDTKLVQKNGLGASKDMSPVPSKRRKMDSKSEFSDYPADQNVSMLVMVPDAFATVSHEAKKEFLLKYFHVKPYPTKREIELLAHVLDMWKSDVASFFGTRRYICMKFLKNHEQQVLLGFKMADLKKLKHDIELSEDY